MTNRSLEQQQRSPSSGSTPISLRNGNDNDNHSPTAKRRLQEVDFYRNPTMLSRLIINENYKAALNQLEQHPNEASIWIVKVVDEQPTISNCYGIAHNKNHQQQFPSRWQERRWQTYQGPIDVDDVSLTSINSSISQNNNSFNGSTTTKSPHAFYDSSSFRKLPIHMACNQLCSLDNQNNSKPRQELELLIRKLVFVYPDGCQYFQQAGQKQEGRIPIHDAVWYNASPSTISCLLMAYPESIHVTDQRGISTIQMNQYSNNNDDNLHNNNNKEQIKVLLEKGVPFWKLARIEADKQLMRRSSSLRAKKLGEEEKMEASTQKPATPTRQQFVRMNSYITKSSRDSDSNNDSSRIKCDNIISNNSNDDNKNDNENGDDDDDTVVTQNCVGNSSSSFSVTSKDDGGRISSSDKTNNNDDKNNNNNEVISKLEQRALFLEQQLATVLDSNTKLQEEVERVKERTFVLEKELLAVAAASSSSRMVIDRNQSDEKENNENTHQKKNHGNQHSLIEENELLQSKIEQLQLDNQKYQGRIQELVEILAIKTTTTANTILQNKHSETAKQQQETREEEILMSKKKEKVVAVKVESAADDEVEEVTVMSHDTTGFGESKDEVEEETVATEEEVDEITVMSSGMASANNTWSQKIPVEEAKQQDFGTEEEETVMSEEDVEEVTVMSFGTASVLHEKEEEETVVSEDDDEAEEVTVMSSPGTRTPGDTQQQKDVVEEEETVMSEDETIEEVITVMSSGTGMMSSSDTWSQSHGEAKKKDDSVEEQTVVSELFEEYTVASLDVKQQHDDEVEEEVVVSEDEIIEEVTVMSAGAKIPANYFSKNSIKEPKGKEGREEEVTVTSGDEVVEEINVMSPGGTVITSDTWSKSPGEAEEEAVEEVTVMSGYDDDDVEEVTVMTTASGPSMKHTEEEAMGQKEEEQTRRSSSFDDVEEDLWSGTWSNSLVGTEIIEQQDLMKRMSSYAEHDSVWSGVWSKNGNNDDGDDAYTLDEDVSLFLKSTQSVVSSLADESFMPRIEDLMDDNSNDQYYYVPVEEKSESHVLGNISNGSMNAFNHNNETILQRQQSGQSESNGNELMQDSSRRRRRRRRHNRPLENTEGKTTSEAGGISVGMFSVLQNPPNLVQQPEFFNASCISLLSDPTLGGTIDLQQQQCHGSFSNMSRGERSDQQMREALRIRKTNDAAEKSIDSNNNKDTNNDVLFENLFSDVEKILGESLSSQISEAFQIVLMNSFNTATKRQQQQHKDEDIVATPKTNNRGLRHPNSDNNYGNKNMLYNNNNIDNSNNNNVVHKKIINGDNCRSGSSNFVYKKDNSEGGQRRLSSNDNLDRIIREAEDILGVPLSKETMRTLSMIQKSESEQEAPRIENGLGNNHYQNQQQQQQQLQHHQLQRQQQKANSTVNNSHSESNGTYSRSSRSSSSSDSEMSISLPPSLALRASAPASASPSKRTDIANAKAKAMRSLTYSSERFLDPIEEERSSLMERFSCSNHSS